MTMSGTHGDLFAEIGKMVLAAHAGQAIDLQAKSEELAHRYWNLGVPADTMAKAIARSVGAIGMSMAIVSHGNGGKQDANGNGKGHPNGDGYRNGNGRHLDGERSIEATLNSVATPVGENAETEKPESPVKAAAALFPSGLRLAVLS
jgi:hypothetical protein